MKSVVCILSILILTSMAVFAADPLSGKWKGEIAAGPCGGFGARGGSPGGGPPGSGGPSGGGGGGRGGGGLDFASEMVQRGGGPPAGGGSGGFPGGPGAGRPGGTQKVVLNIKAKEDKKAAETRLTGNLTIGDSTEDVKDGKVEGVRLSFITGKPPNAVCKYAGELDSDSSELRMTREAVGNAAGEIHFTLKH
jgi:hypothetical protein